MEPFQKRREEKGEKNTLFFTPAPELQLHHHLFIYTSHARVFFFFFSCAYLVAATAHAENKLAPSVHVAAGSREVIYNTGHDASHAGF